VLDSDALAQGVVSFDGGGELALGIDGEGELNVAAFREVLSELAEDFDRGNRGLAGEDGVAVVVTKLFAFGVEPAGVDGGLEAPGMEREREIVTNPGDVVLGCGLFESDVSVGAVGALHVFEFDDGDAGAGRRFERSRVVNRGGGGSTELGARSGSEGH